MSLDQKLSGMMLDATPEEFENYKLLLCMAAGGLAPRGTEPVTDQKKQAFSTVIKNLKALGPAGETWIGRPGFMTNKLLRSLQLESREVLKTAKLTDRYFLGCGGQVADKFALSPALIALVNSHYPTLTATGIASYIYYEDQGHGLDPHVDTEIYTINVIVMLEHEFSSTPSALLIYDDINPCYVVLEPGQLAIINAGSVVHARQDVGAGEKVRILTIGFN